MGVDTRVANVAPAASVGYFVISVNLLSLLVAHLSDAPRRRLVDTGMVQGYRTKLMRALPGSSTCLVYSKLGPRFKVFSERQ